VPHHVPQASLHVVEGASLVVPLRIGGLPGEIVALGQPWQRKVEFHLTAISARKLAQAGAGRDDLWAVVRRVASGRLIGPVVVGEEIRRVSHPEKPGLRTLIVMARADGMAELYRDLSAALAVPLHSGPPHVTLYSSDPAEGIGIDDAQELATRAPQLPEHDQRAIRVAMSFDEVLFDDGGISPESYPSALAVGATDPVFTPRVLQAIAYAAHVHRGQRRAGGEVPYLAHLLAVASLVAEDGGTETEVLAAVLHDTAEDHGGEHRLTDIERRFGTGVRAIVRAMSDSLPADGEPEEPWAVRKRRYLERLRVEQRAEALRVSNADKLHNARSVLAEHRRVGAEVWQELGRSSADQLAYYRELAGIFNRRGSGSALAREFEEVVRELERRVAAEAR
jgi:hypothetical protein